MQPKASTVPTCLLLVALALLAAPAAGEFTYWQVGTDTWFSDPNWTMGIPQVGDTASINNAGTAQIASGSGETTNLYLGYAGGDSGTVELSGTGQLSAASSEYLGWDGTGTFRQTGGTNTVTSCVYLGFFSTGQGTYELSGTGQLSAGLHEYVGHTGTGTFTQTGGTNTVNDILFLALMPAAQGTYELSGTGSLSAAEENVGYSGTGTFTQTGGTNTVTNWLYVGRQSTAQGTYALSGTGQLSAGYEIVGYYGTGTFTQTGGTNTVTNYLYLGYDASSDGTYALSGGSLTVGGQIQVGYAGAGRFEWNSGTLSAGGMTLGSQGTLAMGYDFNVADLGAGHLPGTAVPVSGLDVGTLEVTNSASATQSASLTLGALAVKPGSLYFLDGGVLTVPSVLNEGELVLGGLTCRVTGGTVTNQGFLRGTGRIDSVLTNEATGEVRVASGERLVLMGAGNTNAGKIEVIGGEIEFTQDLTNQTSVASLISASHATLRFGGGLTNNAPLVVSLGDSHFSGDINNTAAGTIIVSGNAGATFYDDVTNAGTIQVSAGSTAVFFGAFSGSGTTGAGEVFLEGDTRPGMSAGAMSFGGDVFLGPAARLEVELGGTAAGSEHDQVNVAGEATLDGTLAVSLIGSFAPAAGDAFTVLTYGSRSGEFAAITGWEHDELAHLAFYNASDLTLHCTWFGDANLDGQVDGADYTLWADHYDQSAGWGEGDFTGDGYVDGADYTVWADNYGAGRGSSVPEPVMLALLALGGLALIRRRR